VTPIAVGAVVLVATIPTALLFRTTLTRWRAFRHDVRQLCTCGFVAPSPTERQARALRAVARILVWLQIGRVEPRGLEHLSGDLPLLIAPTHGHYLDPFVLATIVPGRPRCMTARGLLESGGGLVGLLLTQWGAFCVDLRAGKGAPALTAAVRLLSAGETVVMFPEGWAHLDGRVGPFMRGAVGIARLATVDTGRPVSIVPVYLRYGTYPGAWIIRLWPPLQYMTMFLGLVFYRRGVRVIFGRPLTTAELPDDAGTATDRLRNAVLTLCP